jgi:hypothetical protein
MQDNVSPNTPKEARGGTFAPADIKLIKSALIFYAGHSNVIDGDTDQHIVNLLHRLTRIQ